MLACGSSALAPKRAARRGRCSKAEDCPHGTRAKLPASCKQLPVRLDPRQQRFDGAFGASCGWCPLRPWRTLPPQEDPEPNNRLMQ